MCTACSYWPHASDPRNVAPVLDRRASAYHGTGAAQALEKYAEAFVRARGGYLLLVETSTDVTYERARAFYRKQGYAQLAQIPDDYKPLDHLLIYGKRLGPE